jgi:glycosyltransferase involved in cell wall biosynthesis
MQKPKNIINNVMTEEIEGIKYIWLPSRIYNANKNFARFINLVRFFLMLLKLDMSKYVELVDVAAVIGSSPSIFSGFNAYKIAKRCDAKFIFEVRDIWPLSLVELKNVSKINPVYILMKWFENHAYRKAHAVVSLLPNAKQHMTNRGMRESKFKWIPNGIDLELFDCNKGEHPKEIDSLPSNKFIVGYVGSIGVVNMLDYFIEAASKMKDYKDIQFVMVGDGPEKHKLVEKSKDLENITFIDYVRKEQVPKLIREFDVCFISLPPRRVFEFGVSPNKMFDYMYVGKPILQAISSPANPVDQAKCGITVEAESSDAIVEGILKLYNSPQEKLIEMGEAGKKYVTQNHDYRKLVNDYLHILYHDGVVATLSEPTH